MRVMPQTANPGSALNPMLDTVVTFIQNDIPGFEAGLYRLSIGQELTSAEGTVVNDAPIALTYDFAVSGDRFAFAQPDQTVFAVFPPDNSSGQYDTVFPHAVFPLTNLPWLRSPTLDHPEPNAAGDLPSWLWVLLLDDRDAAATPGLVLDPKTGVIGDLFPSKVYASSSLGDGVSYFSGGGDESDLEPGQTMQSPIQFIDLPPALFDALAPSVDDLRVMAHVRQVSLTQKPTMAGISDKGIPTGGFSIVFGNRLPQQDANTRCYLVSLEAMEQYLPGSGGSGAAGWLRLAVLRSWRFRTTGQPAGFVDALMELNAGTENQAGEKRTVLQLPYAGSNPVLQAGFEMGYVPLDTVLRTGEKTLSWYRGPLAPYAAVASPPDLPLTSADAGLSFDPTTGMFDMSFAAAWTIGRQIALQDQSFSVPLYVWKRDLHHRLLASVSGGILAKQLGNLGPISLPAGLAARFDGIGAAELDTAQQTKSFAAAAHLIIHMLAERT